jgi:hypothetical protein
LDLVARSQRAVLVVSHAEIAGVSVQNDVKPGCGNEKSELQFRETLKNVQLGVWGGECHVI